MNIEELLRLIDEQINTNGANAITGEGLNKILRAIAEWAEKYKAERILVYKELPRDKKASPNVVYNFGDSYPREIGFREDVDQSLLNVWCFIFTTPEHQKPHSIDFGGFVKYWVGGSAPSFQPDTYYEIRIINNVGRYIAVPLDGGGGDEASASYNSDFNSDF